ncbi:MAG: hypothetical protein J6L03_09115 [Bacteroidaceae bacterium]|nr:hypothetical protein [Bacteroidaceae bacterium]
MEKEKIEDVVTTTEQDPATGEVTESTTTEVTAPSGREKIVERLRTYNPEGVYDEDEALYEGVGSMLDERDNSLSEMRGKIDEFAGVLKRNPQTASFYLDMAEGKGLYESLGRNFGPDLMAAINGDDEARAELDRGLAEWQAAADERDARNNTFKTNSNQTMADYEAWLAEEGYSPEDRAELEAEMLAVSNAMGEGKFMDFVKSLHRSRRYDRDIENARSEGEIRGRNARIAEERTLPKEGDGLPNMQGAARPEEIERKPNKWSEEQFWGS